MIVSLPMYDWPEVCDATDAWWRAIAGRIGVDCNLDRRPDYTSTWRERGLLFSQTCGYPFTHEFRGRLELVATPHYAVDGCQGPDYCSFVFAREDKPPAAFAGARTAVNNPDSMSGMLALKLVFAPLARAGRFFSHAIETGSHLRSLLAVRDGEADVCAVDAVCVAMARRYRPDCLEGLVEIARSPLVPSLPYVTRTGPVEVLRRALVGAIADPLLAEVRDRLFIQDMSILTPGDYDRIVGLEAAMERKGGLALP